MSDISYSAWNNFSKSYLWFIGSTRPICRKKRKKKAVYNHKEKLKDTIIGNQVKTIVDKLEVFHKPPQENIKVELITVLKQFLERKHIAKHIEKCVPDRRNPDLTLYSKQSIMMSALAIFLFRMSSGNQFNDKSHDNDERYSNANMAKFIDAPKNRVPVIKTIEKFLENLEENSMNDLMINFFKDLQQSKFFAEHPRLMPGDFFLLAADCVHTHTYDHPHHLDKDGNNDCSYCLSQVHNPGEENEYIQWQHRNLVFSFIFMGGLKIPIYSYPIHASQVVHLENASEEVNKQECEIIGLKISLPLIREAFPRMKIILLLDGLYANKPVIQLAEEQKCGYIIVRKGGCLPLLAKECDEHATNANHKKNCVKKCSSIHKNWMIEHKYEWFNSMYLGEAISTHVLRFWERRTKEDEEELYQCEWLFSWKLSANNCRLAALQARSRWEIEDLFNSLKRRGYHLKHDYSRNPLSCFNWQGLALLSFGIFELFRFCELVKKRGNWSQLSLAKKLLGQLLHRPTDEIFPFNSSKKRLIQFRYHFVVIEFMLYDPIHQWGHAPETG